MTGYDLLKKSLLRLGYENLKGESFFERGIEAINQICNDLNVEEINNLADVISTTNEGIECLVIGIAMILSFAEGDSEKNQIFTPLYNAKRASFLSKIDYIVNKMPVAEGSDNL